MKLPASTVPVAALTKDDVETITPWEEEAKEIVAAPACPEVIPAKICRQCSMRWDNIHFSTE